MNYGNVRKAEFVKRLNRFICEIVIDTRVQLCHVKNTGRLSELLTSGAEIYVTESSNAERKTKYDLVTVVKDGEFVNIDSIAPNIATGEYLRKAYPNAKITPEKKYGNSRFDFYIENGSKKGFIEVKGVTLFRDGKALFPDAPTDRGIKHLAELCKSVNEGYFAKVFFVIAADTKGRLRFSPNRKVGEDFANALASAKNCGVEICAFDCNVTAESIAIKEQIDVVIN